MTSTPSHTGPAGAATGAPVGDPRRWAGLAVLSASLIVVVMDMTILNVALPDLARDLGVGAVAQLWIVDAYALVLAGLLIPVAALADRWGRRRMLLLGYAIFALASTLVLFADSAAAVIALRAGLGIGGAMIMPATLSLIRALFPDPHERAFALSIWAAMAGAGSAAGPVVGGALLEAFSWHAAFLVNVPLMLVGIAAGLWLLPESRSDRPGVIDPAGVVLSVGGMTAVVYAVKHLGKYGADPLTLVILTAGVLAMTAFVRRCLHQPDPMLAVRLFAVPGFRAGVLTALTSATVMMALLFVGSQWLQLVQGWSPLIAGVALLPMALGGLVGSPMAPALAARVGLRTMLVGGLVVLASGLLVIGLLPHPLPYVGVAVGLLLVGFGTAALGLGSALIMGSAPTHQAGSAAAVEEMSYEIGAVLGVALLGSLAGIVYRHGLPDSASPAAVGALAGALGSPSAGAAMASFTEAVSAVGLAGGVLTLLAAVVVWRSIPPSLELADLAH
ncbi:MFS transporter [Nocardioides sp. R-C-SC26]|uniref:MFS transporter n=1 Tax=Nocardioides sp. R-C-SC26 TaxID=2870414 RepID=UPI001E329156|nr:MFS transporter [Nocardioides sp. R-C-SC26]